jgi:4-hydroxy-4-methyl-2-oxoglutarate aldolase
VVAIAREHEEAVLAVAEEISDAEELIRVTVRTGMRLDEARRLHHYHQLQSRKK